MAGSGTESPIRMLAGHDEIDYFVSRQRSGMAKQMQGSQAPVQAIKTKMLCEPILILVFPLSAI